MTWWEMHLARVVLPTDRLSSPGQDAPVLAASLSDGKPGAQDSPDTGRHMSSAGPTSVPAQKKTRTTVQRSSSHPHRRYLGPRDASLGPTYMYNNFIISLCNMYYVKPYEIAVFIS